MTRDPRDSTSRRQFIQRSALATLALTMAGPRSLFGHSRNGQSSGVRIQDLRGGLGVFEARGGSILFAISDGHVALVDSQFPQTVPVCVQHIEKSAEKPFDVLVNTHHHADHTQGNGHLRPLVEHIVAHETVPGNMTRQAAERGLDSFTVPDIGFDHTFRMDLGVERIRARWHGPAHTGGDISVTFEGANVVHMGDLVFNGRHPYIDPPAGASVVNWPSVLDAIVAEHDDETIYVFGHARPDLSVVGARKDVEHFRDYLLAALEHVMKGRGAGRTKEEIAGLEALPGFEKFLGSNVRSELRRTLTCAYDDLEKIESGTTAESGMTAESGKTGETTKPKPSPTSGPTSRAKGGRR